MISNHVYGKKWRYSGRAGGGVRRPTPSEAEPLDLSTLSEETP